MSDLTLTLEPERVLAPRRPRAPRLAHDAYMTPWPAHFIRELTLSANVRGTVFEPCVGDGALAAELRKCPLVMRVLTNDIRPAVGDRQDDARDPATYQSLPADVWVVTNPPFNQALAILMAARGGPVRRRVALLLRMSFLEPTVDRVDYLRQDPPTKLVVMPRTRFDPRKAGTDSVTVGWHIWDDEPNWCPIRVAPRFPAVSR